MLVGCKAIINGIAPLFIFALMMSLSIKILDRSAYQPKIIQREHQVWHNFIALVFGFKVGLFSLPFYVAFKKEQSHICKGTKMKKTQKSTEECAEEKTENQKHNNSYFFHIITSFHLIYFCEG